MVLAEFCHNIVGAYAHVAERTGSSKEMQNDQGHMKIIDKRSITIFLSRQHDWYNNWLSAIIFAWTAKCNICTLTCDERSKFFM